MDTRKDRRQFINGLGLAAGAVLLSGCGDDDDVVPPAPKPPENVKTLVMRTTWSSGINILRQAAEDFAELVFEMSGRRLMIDVLHPEDYSEKPLTAFTAMRRGVIDISYGAAYYWNEDSIAAAAPFFAAVPFGMNAQQVNSWLFEDDGLRLWRELYEQVGAVPFPMGNTGVQMGGWFRNRIESAEDFRGLRIRMPGLGGEVLKRLLADVVNVPGGEIRGRLAGNEGGEQLDAAEWIGPFDDFSLGLHQAGANFYHYPGWHECGLTLELSINKAVFESLPKDMQSIIEAASRQIHISVLSRFESYNFDYLEKIQEHGIQAVPFPSDVLETLFDRSQEVIEDAISRDLAAAEVHRSYEAFRKRLAPWADRSEKAYYSMIASLVAGRS